jgi:ABC-2 type transport system permease protein
MRRAIAVEMLKIRHAPVVWITTLLVVLLVPPLCLGFVAAASGDMAGALGAKASAMVTGEGWDAYLGLLAQIVAVTMFIGPGVVVSWAFGREHAEHTFPSLFALPVSRRAIAVAKFIVLAGWGLALTVVLLATSVVVGLVANVGPLSEIDLVPRLARLGFAGVLTVIIALTVGLVASIGRGYLPAIGAIILLTAAAQIAVLFGTGGWFPYSAPGLFAMAGADGIPTVGGTQLLLVPIVAIAACWATAAWWQRADVT